MGGCSRSPAVSATLPGGRTSVDHRPLLPREFGRCHALTLLLSVFLDDAYAFVLAGVLSPPQLGTHHRALRKREELKDLYQAIKSKAQ